MADTKYTYSVATDTAQGVVDLGALEHEIQDSDISSAAYLFVSNTEDVLDIWFDGALSAGDETTLDGVVAAHLGLPLDIATTGGIIIDPIPAPSDLAVAPQGTTGSTSWGYCVTAYSPTGETLECEEVLISNGAATLNGTNYNRITWSKVTGAVKYSVYRTTAGGTPSSVGKIRTTTLLQVNDKGLTASGALPSEDKSGALVLGGEVVASGGKKLDIRELTTDNSTVTSLVAITRCSSDVVEAGFGTGLYVRLNDDEDVLRDAGAMHFLWSDPDSASPDCDFRVMLRDGGGSMEERLKITSGGQLHLAGVTVIQLETSRVGFPVDIGIRGGSAAASSNNDVPSVTFAATAESRLRWTCRPPQNYSSGDLTLRALCSFAGTAGNTGVRWQLDWSCLSAGDTLPASYQHSVAFTENENDKTNDVLFNVDFTIPAAQFDKTKDMLALWLRRDGDHTGDTCTLVVHVHMCELRYTGRTMAGQPGQ